MTYIMCLNDGRIFKTQKECAEYYHIDHVLLNHVIAGRRKSTDNKVFIKCMVSDTLSAYSKALELAECRRHALTERMHITGVKCEVSQTTIFKLECEE